VYGNARGASTGDEEAALLKNCHFFEEKQIEH
jgi:hypothetical protein